MKTGCTRTQTAHFFFFYLPQFFTNKHDYLTCKWLRGGIAKSHGETGAGAHQRCECFRAPREAAGSRETRRLTGASVNLRCAARLSYIPLMTCVQLCLSLGVKLPRARDVRPSERLLLCAPRIARIDCTVREPLNKVDSGLEHCGCY